MEGVMTVNVGLRGYPEAILAADSATVDIATSTTAGEIIRSVAAGSPQLREGLLRPDGVPRQSTKVIVDGVPVTHSTRFQAGQSVVILAVLPCDG
jgi:hypothetical protein